MPKKTGRKPVNPHDRATAAAMKAYMKTYQSAEAKVSRVSNPLAVAANPGAARAPRASTKAGASLSRGRPPLGGGQARNIPSYPAARSDPFRANNYGGPMNRSFQADYGGGSGGGQAQN